MSIDSILANAKEADAFSSLSEEQKAEADLLAEIAMQIHRKRMSMNMTQEQFAQFNNVSQTMVSKWESGEYNFSIQSLAKLFDTLGLKISVLPKETTVQDETVFEYSAKSSIDEKWQCGVTSKKSWTKKSYSQAVYAASK